MEERRQEEAKQTMTQEPARVVSRPREQDVGLEIFYEYLVIVEGTGRR
jgi:hypothetical protein